jgi:hypothetical protein
VTGDDFEAAPLMSMEKMVEYLGSSVTRRRVLLRSWKRDSALGALSLERDG